MVIINLNKLFIEASIHSHTKEPCFSFRSWFVSFSTHTSCQVTRLSLTEVCVEIKKMLRTSQSNKTKNSSGNDLRENLESCFFRTLFEVCNQAVVVRVSTLQSVVLGFISQVESYQKTSKMVFTASLLGAEHKWIVWRTSRQACLLCPSARHFTGRPHLYVANSWPSQEVYPFWRPSLTED